MTENKQLSLGSRACAARQMVLEKPFRSRNTHKYKYNTNTNTNTNTLIERESLLQAEIHNIGKLGGQFTNDGGTKLNEVC